MAYIIRYVTDQKKEALLIRYSFTTSDIPSDMIFQAVMMPKVLLATSLSQKCFSVRTILILSTL